MLMYYLACYALSMSLLQRGHSKAKRVWVTAETGECEERERRGCKEVGHRSRSDGREIKAPSVATILGEPSTVE